LDRVSCRSGGGGGEVEVVIGRRFGIVLNWGLSRFSQGCGVVGFFLVCSLLSVENDGAARKPSSLGSRSLLKIAFVVAFVVAFVRIAVSL
jgi:hypothetical protein